MDVVFARDYEDGICGIEGIFTYAAAGCESQMTAEDLLRAVRFAQDQEGRISEEEYLEDETGKIHAITLDKCEEYLAKYKEA